MRTSPRRARWACPARRRSSSTARCSKGRSRSNISAPRSMPRWPGSADAMAFVKLAETADIPEKHGTCVEHDGRAIAIFNAGGGRFHACSALCPHEDGPLADGWIEGAAVVCPWHGFDFDLATGECRVADDLSITVFPARVVNGAVEVDVP